jgi:protein LTV1
VSSTSRTVVSFCLLQVRKKQFINKKTAQHFHVVHRSQRDPKANDPDASKYVLLSSNRQVELASDDDDDDEEEEDDDDESDDEMPDLVDSPRSQDGAVPQSFEEALKAAQRQQMRPTVKKTKKTATTFATRRVRFGSIEAEDLVDENGMVRDGYDYTQHLKEMGKGRFYSANGQFASQMDLARRVDLPSDVLPSAAEQDRLLDAITLTTETMDADLREALLNDEAFEEMDDDFVVQAAQEDPDAETGNDGFDYDAHIAKLMAAASGVGVPKFRGNLTDDEDEEDDDEDEEVSDGDEDGDDEYADLDGYAGADRSEKQRVLDEAFEKMLAEEYDDDQLGELEEDDPETRGDVVLEGDLLDAIVEDFVHVRQEMLNDEGKLGNPLRTGNRLQEILEECEKERLADAGEDGVETEEEDPLTVEEDARQTEQALRTMFERNAYLVPREQEQWDCETIVSTYSTLDNHPTLLREDGVLKKKKKKKVVALDEHALADAARNKSQIVLSRKTGMPLGIFESEASAKKDKVQRDATASAAVVTAPKLKREESKDDKKARKEAAKQQKQQRRQEKKQWKTAFKEEEQRQLTLTQPGKVSVFKYT